LAILSVLVVSICTGLLVVTVVEILIKLLHKTSCYFVEEYTTSQNVAV